MITKTDDMSIILNGIKFTIREAKPEELTGSNDFGFTDYRNHEIAIDPTLPENEQILTLRHEALHASMYAHGFGSSRVMGQEQIAEWFSKCSDEVELQLLNILGYKVISKQSQLNNQRKIISSFEELDAIDEDNMIQLERYMQKHPESIKNDCDLLDMFQKIIDNTKKNVQLYNKLIKIV